MPNDFLMVAHAIQAEIDLTPNAQTRSWTVFGAGIENFTEALNETVQQYFFYADHGFARNYVTGMAPAYTCTGRRIIGDPAQDYIFNAARKFGLMVERNTSFRISVALADGTISQITCPVTIANATDLGGATTDGAAVSFEVRVNGKPTVSTITPATTLTVTSVAGTNVGDTLITVTEAPTAGCKFVYAYGTVAPTAEVGSVITGWNDFTNATDYTVPSGQYFVVASISTATNVVVATGQATVVSKTE